jgi:hypothetical protein
MEGGGGVGGRGRGSAPQQRCAWNTDSLLLPGQMSPTPAIGCVLTSPGVAGTRVPRRGCLFRAHGRRYAWVRRARRRTAARWGEVAVG